MEELAAEIVATGEHGMFYNVTEFRVNPNPVMGTASTLSVEYEDGDLEHMQQVWERVKAVGESVITPGMREYEIAKALHDWLVLNCSYDLDWNLGENGAPLTMIQGDTFHLAYGALVKGEAVCAGYARACQTLIWTQYYFISNGNQWTSEQICTSTRYDNVMPSGATEQAKQAGRQAAETRTHDDRIKKPSARFRHDIPKPEKGKEAFYENMEETDQYDADGGAAGRCAARDRGRGRINRVRRLRRGGERRRRLCHEH